MRARAPLARQGRPRFRYRAYGRVIESDFELAGLPVVEGADGTSARLAILRSTIDDAAIRERDPVIFVDRGDEQLLAWSMVGAFRITSNEVIEVDPNVDAPDALVALPLLGTVLATLLHRSGLSVFHASAVSVKGRGIALLGDKGAGKSTSAGALVAGGHRLIADDIVALDFGTAAQAMVLPAFGQLKLWDDSGARLHGAGITAIGRLHAGVDKSHYALPGKYALEPTPIARLYVLARAETPGVARLDGPEGLSQLLRHAYMARFGERGFGKALPSHFLRAAQLVKEGRVRRLDLPTGLDRIEIIPTLVEADLAGDGDIVA